MKTDLKKLSAEAAEAAEARPSPALGRWSLASGGKAML